MSHILWRYNRWLAVSLGAAIAGLSLLLTFGLVPLNASPVSPGNERVSPLLGNYQSPDRCRECHEEEYRAWSGTVHAQASFDPIFQVYLQSAEQPGECFACHTTGYDTTTGQFMLAGVSCEACHGPYRTAHPEENMIIAQAETLCGACHTSTLSEWRVSHHGKSGVTCIDCHEVHTQKTREEVVTNALCAGCHVEGTRDDMHTVHLQASTLCVDCHLSRSVSEDVASAVSGHAATGHSFAVIPSACRDCHDQDDF